MSKKDPLADNLNEKINIPKVNSGLSKFSSGGRVKTNWQEIKWTGRKLFLTSLLLGLPYLIAIIVSWLAGIYFITTILIGLGILVAFLFQVTRWIDSEDDF